MKIKRGVMRTNLINSRKINRKEKRQQKKIHRKEYYSKKNQLQGTNIPGKFVKRPAEELDFNIEFPKKKPKQCKSVHDVLNKERLKEKKEADKLKTQMEKQRRKMLLQANDEDDIIIKKLEKQLGLNKTKNKNNYFAEDGLDYLLEVCDRATSEQITAAEKHLANVDAESDFVEDLALITGKQNYKKKAGKESNDANLKDTDIESDENTIEESDKISDITSDTYDDDEIQDIDRVCDSTEGKEKTFLLVSTKDHNKKVKLRTNEKENKIKKTKIVSEDEFSNFFSEDEISHLSVDIKEEENNVDNQNNDRDTKKAAVWEDIYGRKRDREGNVIKEVKGIYIPPHLRDKELIADKNMVQLERQMKSVLNKLAETNMHWACNSIEDMYSKNSRHSVNTALTKLWLEATVSPATTPDRMVAEYAALISVLHANIGMEIGAHFLQELSKLFDNMTQCPQPVEDKRLDNLVSCLAYLYSFKIYHASLLYDILNHLLDDISEKNIDCVLVALRSVGGVLRKDEPIALKAFIHDTQGKVAKLNERTTDGSRIKFLLEVLLAVKNNNLSKIPNYDPSYLEHLKKMTKGIIRKGNYITPLNIRLEDLLKADERGKWWVVGSAWEGSQVRQHDKPELLSSSIDQKLLELAKKQRMNTEIRRSIFCIIMAAEDYMDAFEKLQHLSLKGQQEREIVHVLLSCCLHEKVYNPYYAVLGQKLCDFDRKYQLSIQYSVWDKIKDLNSLSKQGLTNLAQFLIHIILEKGLPLSVLKVIQFSDLNKRTVRFMRQILLAIIMNADLEVSLQVFHRVCKSPKLQMFRESLKLFIQHFLIKNTGKKNSVLDEKEMATLKERALQIDKILSMHESKLKF